MFGIGLPEFILILAVALIVVGPDKLPKLAKTVAKHLLELKKAANTFKESLEGEINGTTPAESTGGTPVIPANPYLGESPPEAADTAPAVEVSGAGDKSSSTPDATPRS